MPRRVDSSFVSSVGPVCGGVRSSVTHDTSSNTPSDARANHLIRSFYLGIIRAHSSSAYTLMSAVDVGVTVLRCSGAPVRIARHVIQAKANNRYARLCSVLLSHGTITVTNTVTIRIIRPSITSSWFTARNQRLINPHHHH